MRAQGVSLAPFLGRQLSGFRALRTGAPGCPEDGVGGSLWPAHFSGA